VNVNFVRLSVAALTLAALGATTACSGTAATDLPADPFVAQDDTTTADGGTSPDGKPTRVPCTNTFGSGLSGQFGRLDGTIVAVVPHGHGSCNADRTHVHVQVLSGGSTYDIAVNTDGGFYAQRQVALPGAPWSDGWHKGGNLDYVTDFGLHAQDFSQGTDDEIQQTVEAALATANHVSVYATIYSHGGAHLVHRRGNGQDGALVLNPLSPKATVWAFHFSNQTF
jgi:hypothetical protein